MATRREALEFLAQGAALLVVSGCTDSGSGDPIVLDSYFDSGQGRRSMQQAVAATELGPDVVIGTTSRSAFTESIDGYLRTASGTAFTWTAGASLMALMEGGRLQHVSDVWIEGDLDPRLRRISSDSKGAPYFVPFTLDPWAMYYSRRMFADRGFSVPTDVDELLDFADDVVAAGISPFGLARLAAPALVSLFDYLSLGLNGTQAHRNVIDGSLGLESEPVQATFGALERLAQAEVSLGADAPVALVPSRLSDASSRTDPVGDVACFKISPALVSAVEGFAVAPGPTPEAIRRAIALLGEFSEIGPQNAFLGADSSLLPASPNADYLAMSDAQLKVVELRDASEDIVESLAASDQATLDQLQQRLSAIVRP